MKHFKIDKNTREIIIEKDKSYNVNVDILDLIIDLELENNRLNNIITELEKYINEEQTRLATGTSHTYEDSLDKTRYVNEDIFNEITKIKDKLKELKGENNGNNM